MKENLEELSIAKNEMITSGQIMEAAERYFAPNIKTIDFDGTVTDGKLATLKKLEKFIGSIKNVNEITLHRSVSYDNASFSEYIFSFEMKDGSNIYWHEIIRSIWENGQIVKEQYFKG